MQKEFKSIVDFKELVTVKIATIDKQISRFESDKANWEAQLKEKYDKFFDNISSRIFEEAPQIRSNVECNELLMLDGIEINRNKKTIIVKVSDANQQQYEILLDRGIFSNASDATYDHEDIQEDIKRTIESLNNILLYY